MRVLILGGTAEARELAAHLIDATHPFATTMTAINPVRAMARAR